MSALPLIALLTDFGLRDAYVGIMKGLILQICPQVQLVDLSHAVPQGDLRHAAYQLRVASAYFPRDTVFLTVVDPGVGSDRKALAVRTAQHRFVAPDNGVLSWVLDQEPALEMVSLDQAHWHLPHRSHTFHGRDIFAPCAAHLAQGRSLRELGSAFNTPHENPWPRPQREANSLLGQILVWDHFGNLITNLPAAELEKLERNPEKLYIQIGNTQIIRGLSSHYADKKKGEYLALIGSSGLLEISVNLGNARQELAAEYDLPVRVCVSGT